MTFDGRILGGIGVLAAVVETKSFARAAASLGITASGVSRAIARLEERIEVRLFQRTARSVVLTEEGRRFYETVAPLMRGIEDAASEAAGSKARPRGTLRAAVDSLVARVIVAPNLGPFLRQHPELDLDLIVRDRLGDSGRRWLRLRGSFRRARAVGARREKAGRNARGHRRVARLPGTARSPQ